MRLLLFGFLAFVLAANGWAQEFAAKGKFGMTVGDRIENVEFLDAGKRLRLIGANNVLIWDVEANKLIDSVKFENNESINFGGLDARRETVLSTGRATDRRLDKFAEAAVYDLKTGYKIFTFDRTVASGFWSENNLTFVSADNDKLKPHGYFYGAKTEISLWDGETFRHRKTLAFEKLYGTFLTNDGMRLFVYSEDAGKNEKVEVYDALTGDLQTTLITANKDVQLKSAPQFSRSGKMLGLIVTDKTKKSDRTLLIWNTNRPSKSAFEIKTRPEISSSYFLFSGDEKLVALDAGKTVQIVELETRKKVFEVSNSSLPLYWLADNSIFLYSKIGVNVSADLTAYELEKVYASVEETDFAGNKETRVLDETFTVPAPHENSFLNYSNNRLKIYNSRSGKLLKTLIEIPAKQPDNILEKVSAKIDKIMDIKDTTRLIAKSGWSDDGQFVYAIDQNKGTVSVWEIK